MYMNSKTQILTNQSINYGNKKIDFSLFQTQRKTFRIEVSPDMQVLVKAPKHISNEQILQRVNKKAPWIYRQISYFEDFYPRITPRKYISWETFLYLWKQYILKTEEIKITEDKNDKKNEWIELQWKFMIVNKTQHTSTQKILEKRYVDQAKKTFEKYIYPVLDTFKKHNIYPQNVKIRKMTTRRWSCSKKWNITLNSELVKAPKWCIEYVLTHECCHLVEFKHTKKFYDLLTTTMPDWQKQKNKLEKLLA